MTLGDVAAYFNVSKPTLKRWLMLTRQGRGDLPFPVSPKGCRLLWNREDIVGWRSQIGNVPTPPAVEIETPSERKRQNEKVAKGLEKLGITTQKKGE